MKGEDRIFTVRNGILFVDKLEHEFMKQWIVDEEELEFIFWFKGEYKLSKERREERLKSLDVDLRAKRLLRSIGGDKQIIIVKKKY